MTKELETSYKEQLKILYKELYDLTNPLCKKCRAPQSCCSREYCDLVMIRVEELWQEDFSDVGKQYIFNQNIPFMREDGCILPPHLRPMCTLHHCDINSVGFFNPKLDSDSEIKTKKYFELREKIDELETELF